MTAISRAEKGTPKAKIALESGADETLCSKSAAAMAAAAGTLDLIINTIPMVHDDELYEPLLTDGAVQVVLGVTPRWVAGLVGALTGALPARKTVSSGIGGIAATQEVVDLFDKHRIYPNIEIHPVEEINEIMNKLDKGNDSSVRYVLDMATLNEGAVAKCAAKPKAVLSSPPEHLEAKLILKAYFAKLLFGRRPTSSGTVVSYLGVSAAAAGVLLGLMYRSR